MFVNFVDSDLDCTLEFCEKNNLKMISMPYSIDGKEVFPYIDFKTFDYKAFYNMLREGVLPNTSAISKEMYIKYFEPVFAAGNDIFYIHFSRNMTITFNVMDEAVKELKAKYPERKFLEVDTKAITSLSYEILLEIVDMLNAGKTPEEIVEWSKTEIDHYTMYFFADDLKFFKHSGRVSGLAAVMGTMMGIRPIIYMNNEGKMTSIGKAIGRKKAIEALLNYVDSLGDDIKNHHVVIGHTDAEDIAKEVAESLKAKYGQDLKIDYTVVNPTAGAHCGPNGVGIAFHCFRR